MGQFQPGQPKPERSGRKAGTPNKKSQHLGVALDAVGLNIPEKLMELLPQLSAEKQADVLLNLMSYVYPKRKALEVSSRLVSPSQPQIIVTLPSNGREADSPHRRR